MTIADNILRCQTCKYTEQIHKYSEYKNITNDEMAANPITWYIFEKDAINDILICQISLYTIQIHIYSVYTNTANNEM